MSDDHGASTASTGLSPTVEPASSLAGFAASIPSADRHAALNARMDANRARFDALVEKARAEGRDVFRACVPSMTAPSGGMVAKW